jgi:uncharacterized protein YkwD
MSRLGAFLRVISVVAASTALAGCAGVAQTAGPAAVGGERLDHLERETFALVNDYRRANGLPSLAWDDEIARIARLHSRDMASGEVDFGHAGFSQRIDRLRAVLAGTVRSGGENVLMTDSPDDVARTAVGIWLNSPAHLHNIRGAFNESAIGISESAEGVLYFTQIFVQVVPAAGL